MKIVFSKKLLIPISIIIFPVCNLVGGITDYYDEIIGLIAVIYCVYKIYNKTISPKNLKLISVLILITMLGFLSNILSKLTNNITAILTDTLFLWKTFATFIMYYEICRDDKYREKAVSFLCPLSKITIWFVALTSVIGQVIDIGVVDKTHTMFGLKQFVFFWDNQIQTGWLLFAALLFLSTSSEKIRTFRIYYIIASIPMLLTFSALVYCWLFIELSLFAFLKEGKKFKKRYIVFLGFGVGLLAYADVARYFMEESVRTTLLQFGAYTANNYFPLGSGFATYGSEMARRYYSPLYIEYGWENTWALGRNGNYLNDNFYASIIGQFGWIGFILYLLLLVMLFNSVNSIILNRLERGACISTVITIAVVMIGSASAKSMMGIFTFAVLGIICGKIKSTLLSKNLDKEQLSH